MRDIKPKIHRPFEGWIFFQKTERGNDIGGRAGVSLSSVEECAGELPTSEQKAALWFDGAHHDATLCA